MLHNASVPCFLSCNNFAWNFWTAGLSCGEAFWETWFFRRAYNLFLLQNPLNQLFEYLRLVTVQNFSNIIFFSFDRNHHPFIPFPRLICSWNCLKSSSSRREYWAFLPRMFLLLLFCFLIFSSPATQFLKCFLLTLNLLAVCNIFLLLLYYHSTKLSLNSRVSERRVCFKPLKESRGTMLIQTIKTAKIWLLWKTKINKFHNLRSQRYHDKLRALEGTWVLGGCLEIPCKYFPDGPVLHETFVCNELQRKRLKNKGVLSPRGYIWGLRGRGLIYGTIFVLVLW